MTETPSSSATGGILGGLAQIGRYFQLVSIVPSALVVVIVYALISGGAPGRQPTFDAMGRAIASLNLQKATALALVVVILGMTIHPFQLAAIQFLEGYWGHSRLGRTAMISRALVHHERRRRSIGRRQVARTDLRESLDAIERRSGSMKWLRSEALRAQLDVVAYNTAASRYPEETHRVMPTRLGNVLRRYEDLAGARHDRRALSTTAHLMSLAPQQHIAYVDDTRTDLDLAVRFVVAWVLVATTSFLLLWPYRLWLAVPIVAYLLAWLSYRAAVHAAVAYGNALVVLFDLDHGLLDEHLGLPPRRTFVLTDDG